jgi:hypothetical protein
MENITSLKSELVKVKSTLDGMYAIHKVLIENIEKDFVNRLTSLLNPIHRIGVRFDDGNIDIFTTSKDEYADFGSSFSITNRTDFFDKNAKFDLSMNYGSMGLKFGESGSEYQITKFQLLYFISSDIFNKGVIYHEIENNFKMIKNSLESIRAVQKNETDLKLKNRTIEHKQEESFFSTLSKGNKYLLLSRGCEFTYHIDNISRVNTTVSTYNNSGVLLHKIKLNKVELFLKLKDATLI